MSLLQSIRNNAKLIAKGSMYVGGAIALGYPLIRGVSNFMAGGTAQDSANKVLYEATGYNADTHAMSNDKLTEVVLRDIVGVGALYVAKKL